MEEIATIRKIYDAIADEISRDIFCSRMLYSMTGDLSRIGWMFEDFEKTSEAQKQWISFKEQLRERKEKPYIFSAGAYGRRLCEKTGGAENWSGFIDNAPAGDQCMRLPVLKASDFLKDYAGETIALPSKSYFLEMRAQLLSAGVREESILDATAWYDVTEGRQYFDLPYLEYGSDEVFIDGGACDGLSSLGFVKQCEKSGGSCQKIYCFEPDPKNIGRIQNNFQSRNIENYEIVAKGLWDGEQELLFAANGSANSHIIQGDGKNGQENAVKVSVTALDEVLAGQRASFIKMDVEGAEYKALLGARRTITEYKPKLAICVYHKPEDIWELPALVLDMRPDYKLYFRHYSAGPFETVMYVC